MDEKSIEQTRQAWSNAPDEHVFQAKDNINSYDTSIRPIILEEAKLRIKVKPQETIEQLPEKNIETRYSYKNIGSGLTLREQDFSYLQGRGVAMIALGIAHIVVPQLAWQFGIPLIAAGILNIIFPKRGMFLLNGFILIIVGVWNIFLFIEGGAHVIWKWIAFFQCSGGAEEMGQFFKNRPLFDASQFDAILDNIADNRQKSEYLLKVIKDYKRSDIRREALRRLADIGKDASFAVDELQQISLKRSISPVTKCWFHYALAVLSDQKEAHVNALIAMDQSIEVSSNLNDPNVVEIRQTIDRCLDLLKSSEKLEIAEKDLVKEKLVLSQDTPFIKPVLNNKAVYSVAFWLLPIVGLPLALIAASEIRNSGGKQYGLLLAKISLVVNSILVAFIILGVVIGQLSVMLGPK